MIGLQCSIQSGIVLAQGSRDRRIFEQPHPIVSVNGMSLRGLKNIAHDLLTPGPDAFGLPGCLTAAIGKKIGAAFDDG